MSETWAIVELLGHVRLAGRLSEEEKFGGKLGRLDTPHYTPCECPNAQRPPDTPTVPCDRCHGAGLVRSYVTTYFGLGAIYRITLATEDVVQQIARAQTVSPPARSFPSPLPAVYVPDEPDEYDDEPDEYDDDHAF